MSRKLILIPIVHTPAEMAQEDNRMEEISHRFWELTQKYFNKTPLPFDRLKIFQDSLPITTEERIQEIVNRALPDSPNFNLLRELKRRGAQIIGIEDIALWTLQAAAIVDGDQFKANRMADLRDEKIVRVISETLSEEDIGVLFIGQGHRMSTPFPEGFRIGTPSVIKSFYKEFQDGELVYDMNRYRRL